MGHISIIAKGIRKQDAGLCHLQEYELHLLEPKEEGLYLLKDFQEQRDYSIYPTAATWAAADCGAELLMHLIIPAYEAGAYYELLCNYLGYLQKVDANAVLILWRLFMRVYANLGLAPKLGVCAVCNEATEIAGYSRDMELSCQNCLCAEGAHYFSPLARRILALLPEIGNHLQDLILDRAVVQELNTYFTNYFYAHYHKTLRLKSLSVLCQFYPVIKTARNY